MRRDIALRILRDAAPTLRQRYGVVSARLFGSVARDEADEYSDVDVAVRFNAVAAADIMNLCGVSGLLSDLFGIDVDVVAQPARNAELNAAIDREAVVAF